MGKHTGKLGWVMESQLGVRCTEIERHRTHMHTEWLLNVTCLLGRSLDNAAIDMINEPLGQTRGKHQAEEVKDRNFLSFCQMHCCCAGRHALISAEEISKGSEVLRRVRKE